MTQKMTFKKYNLVVFFFIFGNSVCNFQYHCSSCRILCSLSKWSRRCAHTTNTRTCDSNCSGTPRTGIGNDTLHISYSEK